jgi:hypothetical protein
VIWKDRRRAGRRVLAAECLLPWRHRLTPGREARGGRGSGSRESEGGKGRPAAVEMWEWGMTLGLASPMYMCGTRFLEAAFLFQASVNLGRSCYNLTNNNEAEYHLG